MQQRATVTRQLIIDAAADMFDRNGYSGASLREIVSGHGITKGALYFHFSSKDALAVAVIEEHYKIWPGLVAELRAAEHRASCLMVRLSLAVAERFRTDPLIRAGVRLVFERHLISLPAPQPFTGWTRTMADLLDQARTEGDLLPAVDVSDAAALVVSAFTGIQQVSQALTGRADLPERVAVLWRYLLPGLVTPEALRRLQPLVAGGARVGATG